MINRFSIVFTQAASIDYHHVPLPKIVNSGKFTQHCSPREEGYMRRDFGLAYATPRKSQRGRARSVMLLKLLEGISCQPLQLYGEQVAQVINEGFDAAGHAIGTAWAVFKIRKAFDPKSALKPTILAKFAAEENSAELKA
uniref:Senescence domain-containing protein n=1 Tax=Fagus sylvatica TaxID=28930 RepID=A0A2N9HUZ7_FAGSY